jgi:membrane protease YdiL (CAAX protease family)
LFCLVSYHFLFGAVTPSLISGVRIPDGITAVLISAIYVLGIFILARYISTAKNMAAWLRDCGLVFNRYAIRDLALLLHACIVGIGLYVIPWHIASRGSLTYTWPSTHGHYEALPLIVILLMPTVEEIIFTGFLYGSYRERVNLGWAILFTTFGVVVAHWAVVTESIATFFNGHNERCLLFISGVLQRLVAIDFCSHDL